MKLGGWGGGLHFVDCPGVFSTKCHGQAISTITMIIPKDAKNLRGLLGTVV